MKIAPRQKGENFSLSPPRLAFLAWGDFHERLLQIRIQIQIQIRIQIRIQKECYWQ